MKLRALRVASVGCFSRPVALEGFADTANVFSADNETGKSTLMRALKFAFSEKHTAKGQRITNALRPYEGGTPIIEVDFDFAGEAWRLRKQFLSSPSAQLKKRDGSDLILRGADAENKLHEMLQAGRSAAVPLDVFWLDQQDALLKTKFSNSSQDSLRNIVSQEVASVADGEQLQAVRRIIEDELGELATGAKKQPRANREWDRRLKEQQAAQEAYDQALQRANEAEARHEELNKIEAKIATLSDVAVREKQQKQFEKATAALQKLQQARRSLETAEAQHKTDLKTVELASQKAKDFAAAQKHLSKLQNNLQAAEADLVSAQKHVTETKQEFDNADEANKKAISALKAAQKDYDAVIEAERVREIEAQRSALQKTLKDVDRLQAEAEVLQAAIQGSPATSERITRLRKTSERITTLKVRLEASAPTVKAVYDADTEKRLLLRGKPLLDGEAVSVDENDPVVVPGIGALHIAAGGAVDREDDLRDLDAQQQTHAELLQALSVNSIKDAEVLSQKREQDARVLADIDSRLQVLLPMGYDELVAKCNAYDAQLDAAGAGASQTLVEVSSREDAKSALETCQRSSEDWAQRLDNLRQTASEAGAKQVALEARIGGIREQCAQLEKELPQGEAANAHGHQLQTALEAAQSAAGISGQRVEDLRKEAQDDDAVAKAKEDLDAAQSGVKAAERDLQELEQHRARLQGALARDAEEGVTGKVNECFELLQAAKQRATRMTLDVNALKLLAEEFVLAEQRVRDQFLQPVVNAMAPYVAQIFPSAQIGLTDQLTINALKRGETHEAFDQVSDGTREQLAILVRLGFARLFADAGQPVPVLLDDPLVFSDDTRLQHMFKVLQAAGDVHQVIVLTCRERAFAPLQAHRLQLSSWQEAENVQAFNA